MSAKSDRWKNLERDVAEHFDTLLKRLAGEKCKAGLGQYGMPDGQLIKRNLRGNDFSKEDSDVDVYTPEYVPYHSWTGGPVRIHDLIGGPIIVECKYRSGNPIPRLFNDWAKSRPSSLMTPVMFLYCRGYNYVVRWLGDFLHRDWKNNGKFDELWITSRRLNKTNSYVEEWMQEAEYYIPLKARAFEYDEKAFMPLIATRSRGSKAVVIQRV